MVAARRGFSLANTLFVIAIVAILAFTVGAVSLSHLSVSSTLSNGHQAQNLAESALALGMARLLADPTYGLSRQPAHTVLVERSWGQGRLSFHSATAGSWGLDASTNNLAGDNSVQGSQPDRPVPAHCAYLVAEGSSRGARRRVEAMLYLPPFPYAIATSAPFHSRGNLIVGALAGGDTLGLADLDPAELLEADVASNGTLAIGPASLVTGDVRAAREVELAPGVRIGGRVQSHREPVAIPSEDVRSYDPETLGKPNLQRLDPGVMGPTTLQGFAKCSGSLALEGGLQLDNGVLFVDGDLAVGGGIQGTGAVFVTGSTRLTGATRLVSDNTVALISQGDVTMQGQGRSSSFFQGLLYTEGSLQAEQISLLGVFIQNGDPDTTRVQIDDTALIYVPELARVEVTPRSTQATLTAGNLRVTKDGDFFKGGGDYGSSGPVVFEAYPVTTGGWELADPNRGDITAYDTYAQLKSDFVRRWSGHAKRGDRLLGLRNAAGATQRYDVSTADASKLGPVLDSQLRTVAPRPPGSSRIMGSDPSARLTVDPSRFLKLQDRARLLYWRAR